MLINYLFINIQYIFNCQVIFKIILVDKKTYYKDKN